MPATLTSVLRLPRIGDDSCHGRNRPAATDLGRPTDFRGQANHSRPPSGRRARLGYAGGWRRSRYPAPRLPVAGTRGHSRLPRLRAAPRRTRTSRATPGNGRWMRLLLDTCIWGGAAPELRAAGHDVLWTGDWPQDPGDDEILAFAHRERRVLVTLDKDFGELAIVHEQPHGGIVRIVGLPARQHAGVCRQALDAHGAELRAGAIVTVEPGRLRIRE